MNSSTDGRSIESERNDNRSALRNLDGLPFLGIINRLSLNTCNRSMPHVRSSNLSIKSDVVRGENAVNGFARSAASTPLRTPGYVLYGENQPLQSTRQDRRLPSITNELLETRPTLLTSLQLPSLQPSPSTSLEIVGMLVACTSSILSCSRSMAFGD